jgi:predicted transposase/invertase (TIGR01784 family)
MLQKSKVDDVIAKSTYINPRTDFGFKRIFENKDLMINFLSSVLKENITAVTYQNVEQLGAVKKDRGAVFDILCTLDNGKYIIVEMQNAPQKFFMDRLVYYVAMLLQNQAPRGNIWDFELKAVHVLSILNFVYFKDTRDNAKVIEHVHLTRSGSKKWVYDKVQFSLVELPKFNKALSELHTSLDCWLYILCHLEALPSQPAEVRGDIFDLLFNLAELSAFSKEEIIMYRTSLMAQSDYLNTIAYARETAIETTREEADAFYSIQLAAKDQDIERERAEKEVQAAALERERAEKERERAEKEVKSAALEQALAKIAELTKNNNN